MINVQKALALAGLGVLMTACSSDSKVDIGDGSTSQGLSAYADSWDGYTEAYEFEDGSDGHLRIGDTALLGTPMVGEPAPPWAHYADFAYPIHARLEDGRLRFEVDVSDRYEDWCALQTPVPVSTEYPGILACARNIGVLSESEESCFLLDTHEPVSCSSHFACREWCTCTEESCTAALRGPRPNDSPSIEPDHLFDGALSADGDELTGTLLWGKSIVVRLRRQ
jgi:hypothetical protein